MNLRLSLLPLLLLSLAAQGQDRLSTAVIRAKASRKGVPAIGLPQRTDGSRDSVVFFRDGLWQGADEMKAPPHWKMTVLHTGQESRLALPEGVLALCRSWTGEKPERPLYIVSGPFRGGQFVALCKRARHLLGWKSIAIVIPPEGLAPEKDIYAYSHAVNWLEYWSGYNFFPRLPAHLQEIIEEMTDAELLCPFQEFEPFEAEIPEAEINYDWEEDLREP